MTFSLSYREQTSIPWDRSGDIVSHQAREATTSRAPLACVHWPYWSTTAVVM